MKISKHYTKHHVEFDLYAHNERQNDKRWFTLERLFLQLVIVGLAL